MTTGQREMLIVPGVVVAPQDAREGEAGQRFMTELRNDHGDYSRILSLLSGQIERLPRMPRRTLPLLRDAFEFITAYIDASHHSREDVLYERLARHYRRSARILAHLRQEHSRGLLASRRISAEIAELTRAPHRARLAALARAIDNFVEEARGHISREERIMYSATAWARSCSPRTRPARRFPWPSAPCAPC
jgi:hemerythrin-like domain-containing protein